MSRRKRTDGVAKRAYRTDLLLASRPPEPIDGIRAPTSVTALDHTVMATDEQLASLCMRIRKDLRRFFPHLGERRARIELTLDSRRSSYPLFGADVYVSEQPWPVASLVIKFAPAFSDNNEALTELDNLTLMYDWLGGRDHRLRVPRPLAFYPDMNVLLTERMGGQRLSQLLLASASRVSRRPAARLFEIARLCGRWLREYHCATRTRSVHPFGDDFQAAVYQQIGRLVTHGFDERLLPLIIDTLSRLRRFGRTIWVPVARKHGDFGPQNIHAGDDWIAVFDLSYQADAVIYEDISYFLVTLETMNPYPRHPLFDRKTALRLREPFLRGYFGADSARLDRQLLLAGSHLHSLVARCYKQRRNMHRRGRLCSWMYDRLYVAEYYPQRVEQQCRRVQRLLEQRAAPARR